jgi:RNA polymerase sigma-70 factor (subfamily 1)
MPEESLRAAYDRHCQILERARQGSREALGLLIDQCRNYLLFLARHRRSCESWVKDSESELAQQASVVAVEKFPQFRGQTDDEFRAWLRDIFHSVFREAVRLQSTQKRDVSRERPLDSAEGRAAYAVEDRSCPVAELSRKEEIGVLKKALAALPEHYRLALYWRYNEHLSLQEIGARLGITADAARKICLRAMIDLSNSLQAAGITPPSGKRLSPGG